MHAKISQDCVSIMNKRKLAFVQHSGSWGHEPGHSYYFVFPTSCFVFLPSHLLFFMLTPIKRSICFNLH